MEMSSKMFLNVPEYFFNFLVLLMLASLCLFGVGHGKAGRNDNSAKKISEYFKVSALIVNITFLVCELIILVTA